ncbi:MAG TPA: maleylpyruvate isomerase N-terminal domain-containing protein [Mycobacteriales bacterium]|nr:maleylpyruvate isomerase N-terminal domain-containing protein [Mycobacteriales bacterium]
MTDSKAPIRPDVCGADVLAAAGACRELLDPWAGVRWDVPVPGMGLTVAQVVAHAANGPLWYAFDLWSGPGDDAAFELGVKADAANAAILLSLSNAARVCAASLDAAPAAIRGFHPAGSPDPSGFAAMACDELLVHTHDVARGLGRDFQPDADRAGRILARLFPWHEAGADPWRTLLWANGRLDLPGRPNQKGWRWHCAPLAEWDGAEPALADTGNPQATSESTAG